MATASESFGFEVLADEVAKYRTLIGSMRILNEKLREYIRSRRI